MKTHKAVLACSLVAIIAGSLTPAAVLAGPGWQGGPRPHGGAHAHGGRHVVMGPGPQPGHVQPHRHVHRPFVPPVYSRFPYSSPYFYGTGYYAPPAFYGVSTGYGYGFSSSYDSPLAYPPPPAYAPPPAYGPAPAYGSTPSTYGWLPPVPFSTTTFVAAPTRSSVIEFPTGRYELRGDGISTPYAWVWIPNPPPSAPEWPTATRADAPPPPAPSEAPSPRRLQLYRWVDEQGVVHLTDNPENVPAQYRKPAARGGAS